MQDLTLSKNTIGCITTTRSLRRMHVTQFWRSAGIPCRCVRTDFGVPKSNMTGRHKGIVYAVIKTPHSYSQQTRHQGQIMRSAVRVWTGSPHTGHSLLGIQPFFTHALGLGKSVYFFHHTNALYSISYYDLARQLAMVLSRDAIYSN